MRIFSRQKKGSRKRSWYIDYSDPISGKRIRKVCGESRREAEKFRTIIETETLKGGASQSEPLNPPIYEFLQEYIDHLGATGITVSSLTRFRQILQNFSNFIFNEKKNTEVLGDITAKDIWDYVHYRKNMGMKDKTISMELSEIKKLFRYAIAINAVMSNPTALVNYKSTKDNTPHFFTKDEIKKIFKSFPQEWMRDIFRTFLYTGMRKGELMHLLWKDVDIDNKFIHVRQQIFKDGEIIYKTKTISSARSIPMYDEVTNILIRQRKRMLHKDYVFVNSHCTPFRDDDLYHYLKPRLLQLKIKGSVHTFRHTYASLLIEAGVGLRELKELMGHSRIETTMQYAHLYPQRLHEQIDRLKELSIDTSGK